MNPATARKTMLVTGALVAIVVLGALALPMGEVVTLETRQADGHTSETQLWIVDRAGKAYLRGGRESRWMKRLRARPEVRLRRPDPQASEHDAAYHAYRAREVVDPTIRVAVHEAMAAKYGIADRLVRALSDPAASAIVELAPTSHATVGQAQ